MLRWRGALCCVGAFGWLGLWQGGRYRRRQRCLEDWLFALGEAERLLCDLGMPTSAALRRMAERERLGEMMDRCLRAVQRGEALSPTWSAALGEAAFPLAEADLRPLEEVGAVLGRFDGEQQRRVLRHACAVLSQAREEAAQEDKRLGRMWPALGFGAGVLLTVLLY
ncbi:MAG: stage III sporulation protein AB [Oscillospiraceae bacterium]|nr:stage III sporulation protein AB [Oscillospiraceae bacterium]